MEQNANGILPEKQFGVKNLGKVTCTGIIVVCSTNLEGYRSKLHRDDTTFRLDKYQCYS